jgi:hypothetical protein
MNNQNPNLIGQGTYGCVFKPAFTSKNKKKTPANNQLNKTKKISKLLIKSKDKELKHLKKLHEINSEGKYHPRFNPETNIINSNETAEITESIKDKFKDCKIITNGDPNDKYIINMEFGGKDIKAYLKEKKVLTSQETNIFIRDYINLINGLILFKKHKLSIMDVKDANIVYNTEITTEHKMRFIDFGIMLDYGNITRNELSTILDKTKYLYIYDYINVYPPETLLLINDIFNLIFTYTDKVSKTGNNLSAKNAMIEELKKYKLMGKDLENTELGKMFLKCIDIFIKMFKRNIRKYNYSKEEFHYNLSIKILSLIDTFSLINIFNYYSHYFNNDNQQISKITAIIPKYDGSDKRTVFSLPKLENIRKLLKDISS